MNVKVVSGPRWKSGELEKETYAFLRKIIMHSLRHQERLSEIEKQKSFREQSKT